MAYSCSGAPLCCGYTAVSMPVSVANIEYDVRRKLSMKAKQAIGQAAAGLIEDNTAVAINIGTTTEAVANALFGHDNLMVLTNNLNILQMMSRAPGKQLVLVGGTVRAQDGAVVGGAAVEFIERYKVDYAVVGASALDDDGALSLRSIHASLPASARAISSSMSLVNRRRVENGLTKRLR